VPDYRQPGQSAHRSLPEERFSLLVGFHPIELKYRSS